MYKAKSPRWIVSWLDFMSMEIVRISWNTVVKLKLYCAVLLFVAALFGAGYFLFGSFGERRAANEGGFASVEEMMLTHRLGLASRAEYLAYWEAHQARKRKEREMKAEMPCDSSHRWWRRYGSNRWRVQAVAKGLRMLVRLPP